MVEFEEMFQGSCRIRARGLDFMRGYRIEGDRCGGLRAEHSKRIREGGESGEHGAIDTGECCCGLNNVDP